MTLDAGSIRQIEIGGHLHDIGKIGVREAVLNKPGPLTDEEYRAHHDASDGRMADPLAAPVRRTVGAPYRAVAP